MEYLELFINAFIGTLDWTWKSICFEVPWNHNYFWGLIAISLLVWGAEMLFPWRKQQSVFRKDFFLDGFYMFFNFFIFSMFISGVYKIISKIATEQFQIRPNAIALVDLSDFSPVVQLLIFFVVLDFVQWLTHMVLHRFSFLWKFHKVHHSVKEMGFAAHLRFHWMETVVYKTLEYIPLALIGFGIDDFILVHLFTLSMGHFNHSNISVPLGFLKYIFNNPQMHIWHHGKKVPNKFGVNFGLTLSIWDYLFKTDYIPSNGRDIELGFENDDEFPKDFISQEIYPLSKK